MKKKKVFIGLLLGASALLSLASCGDKENPTTTTPAPATTTAVTPTTTTTVTPTTTTGGNTSTSTTQTTPSDEVNYGTASTSDEIKNCAITQADQMYADASLSDEQKLFVDVSLKYVKAKINASTETDLEALKTEINGYYKALYDTINFTKSFPNVTSEGLLAQIDALEVYVSDYINDANKDYIELAFDSLRERAKDFTPQKQMEFLVTFSSFMNATKKYIDANVPQEVVTAITEAKARIKSIYDYAMAVPNITDQVKEKITKAYTEALARISMTLTTQDKDNIDGYIGALKTTLFGLSDKLLELDLTEYKAVLVSMVDKYCDDMLYGLSKYTTAATTVRNFKDAKLAEIQAATTLDDAKAIYTALPTELTQLAQEVMATVLLAVKNETITNFSTAIDAALADVTDTELVAQITEFKNTNFALITAATTMDELTTATGTVTNNMSTFMTQMITAQMGKIKDKVISDLNTAIDALTSKIKNDDLKASITTFKNEQLAIINAVTTIPGAKTAATTIATNTESFVTSILGQQLTIYKNAAISALNTAIDAGLAKLPDSATALRTELSEFKTTELTKINNATLDTIDTVAQEVATDTAAKVKQIIASSLSVARTQMTTIINKIKADANKTPYDYLPAAMKPGYSKVTENSVTYNFSDDVSVPDINYGGFGAQWHMVTENIDQIIKATKVINGTNALFNTVVTVATTYLADDDNCDSLEFTKETDSYKLYMNYDPTSDTNTVVFNVEYKGDIIIPLFGQVTPKIEMRYHSRVGASEIYIELSSTNKIRYDVNEGCFNFAIEYGIENYGSRTSRFSLYKGETDSYGDIFEYWTAKGKTLKSSVAEFYVKDGYVSVIGNKADAIAGMDGYINELYDADEGKLLGYKVMETKTILGITGTYNTLWFNLNDINGISNIRIVPEDAKDRSQIGVYLNTSAELFKPAYNTTLVKTSRKYDIEYRTRYFYGENSSTHELEEYEVQIPMMFIQDGENYESFVNDMKNTSDIVASVNIDSNALATIRYYYDNNLPRVKNEKEMEPSDSIEEYIDNGLYS